MKIFVDVNIFLDILQKRRNWEKRVNKSRS